MTHWILLLVLLFFIGPELLHLFFAHFGESLIWFGALLGALALWYLGCFAVGEAAQWLGPGEIHDALAIVLPLGLLAAVWVLFFDSLLNFPMVRGIFHWVFRRSVRTPISSRKASRP
jgi:hypothetical protein